MEEQQIEKSSDLKSFLSTLIDSKKLPTHIKNVDEAFTIAQMGKELGFPTMQAFHYIIPIQGKLSLSAKAVGALLRKGGVKYLTKEDALYVYSDNSVESFPIKKADGITILDRRTTIEFYRDGLTESCSFTWKDAEGQGLTTKDNWKKMPKEMLFARCIAKGSNRIGPDLMLGLYTAEEMADTFLKETQVKRNEDGSIAEVTEDINYTDIK